MKIKIAIYGGTDLSPELVAFTASLTKYLLQFPEIIIVSGGFHYSIAHQDRISVDRVVMETAEKYIDPQSFQERFETWLPKENSRRKVQRFRKGKVVEVTGSTQSRRFSMVQHIDALITIQGRGHTRSVIEMAMAINKPVLPIAFTGGDSKKMWNRYKSDFIGLFRIPPKMVLQVQNLPASASHFTTTAKSIASFVREAVKKTCLVLMPFRESDNSFYDNCLRKAIVNSDYVDHRIDRNDPAGNIPELFKTSLETAKAVIIDITGNNPNVMYELGHVHAKNISPLIILRTGKGKKTDKINLPFYVQQEMIVTAPGNKEGFEQIQAAVAAFLKKPR